MPIPAHDTIAVTIVAAIQQLAALARGADPDTASEASEHLQNLATYVAQTASEVPAPSPKNLG